MEAKTRKSNIELFRIVIMLLIIGSHYVMNGGISKMFGPHNLGVNTLFFEAVSWEGKMGINCFLLITGYFMCKQELKWIKFIKLTSQILFYDWTTYFLLVYIGADDFSLISVLAHIPVVNGLKTFTWGYMMLYLLVPFLNVTISALSKKQFQSLLILLTLIYSVLPTLFYSKMFEYVGWYATMYLVGAYIRIYPYDWFNSKKIVLGGAVFSLLLSTFTVWSITWLSSYVDIMKNFQYFVVDSNKPFAFICSVFLFLYFLYHVKISYSRIINQMALTTFGVLLIHMHSDAMASLLWGKILRNVDYAMTELAIPHFIVSVIFVYSVCVVIDLLRIYLIERPLFSFIQLRIKKKY